MNNEQIILSIGIIALTTACIRFLPFLAFRENSTPRWITRLGKTLPYAVMGMLVVYCLKDVSLAATAAWLPATLSVLAVTCSYIWLRNTLVSIVIGTVLNMLLVQFVFV